MALIITEDKITTPATAAGARGDNRDLPKGNAQICGPRYLTDSIPSSCQRSKGML
jgi:hypothetical protein